MIDDDLLEPLFEHVRVDLGRRDVGMTEQALHGAKVRAAVEQMTGEGMTQHVRRHALGIEPCGDGRRLDVLGEALTRQMTFSASGWEQVSRRRHGRDAVGGRAAETEVAIERACAHSY